MFSAEVYSTRRRKLVESVSSGIILIMGNTDVPMNYAGNTYKFRQDSNFLYFFGIDLQGLNGIIDADSGEVIIFGDDFDIDDIIWVGPQESLVDKAKKVGVSQTKPLSELSLFINKAIEAHRRIHFLPPYRAENKIFLSEVTGLPVDELKENASIELIRAIVAQREIKSQEELKEIEKACDIGYKMHLMAMLMAKPGVYEHDIAGAIEGAALAANGQISFPVILSMNGQTLHNHCHDYALEEGRLMICDSGAESNMHYASDFTRTIPVGGKYSDRQKEIYNIVLAANDKAHELAKPGVTYQSIHYEACRVIVRGLKELGLMKGDVEIAVEKGAHALFMPHGLGHQMGLDVHDMEDLGEQYVGYDKPENRSKIFGHAALRMGKMLKPGMVMTNEPGIYFIPELIQKWKSENKLMDFLNYDKIEKYLDFGGIRLEDDLVITETGSEIIGKRIPIYINEIEELMSQI